MQYGRGMEDAIVTSIVTQSPADVLGILTTLSIARIDRLELAAFLADCADEAQALARPENERLFRLAEVMLCGATLGDLKMAEQCTTHAKLLIAGYAAQKSTNTHRAPRQESPAVAPAEPAPIAPVMSTDVPLPVVPPMDEIQSSEVAANSQEPPLVHIGDEPPVRRRQTPPRSRKARKGG